MTTFNEQNLVISPSSSSSSLQQRRHKYSSSSMSSSSSSLMLPRRQKYSPQRRSQPSCRWSPSSPSWQSSSLRRRRHKYSSTSSSSFTDYSPERRRRHKYSSTSSSSSSSDYSRNRNNTKLVTKLANLSKKRPHPDDYFNDDDVQINQQRSKKLSSQEATHPYQSPDISLLSSGEYIEVHGLMVPKRFEPLYHKIYNRYGSIKNTRIGMNKMALEGAYTFLLELVSDMDMRSIHELDESILLHWELKISMLEALELHVEWLRICFNEVKEDCKKMSESKKTIEMKLEETLESIKKIEEEQVKANKELDQWMADRFGYEAKLREVNGKITKVNEEITSMNAERAYCNEVLEKEKQEKQEMSELNVGWLRRCFNKLKNNFEKISKSEKNVEETGVLLMKKVEEDQEHRVESKKREQAQLMAEKDELEAKLREVIVNIPKADKWITLLNAQMVLHNEDLEKEKQEQLEMVQQGSILKAFL